MKIINNNINFKANKMSIAQAKYVDNELKKAKNVDIICHNQTDRDGANSALAMWDYLNSFGINARVIISQKTPETLGLRRYDCNIIQAKDKDEVSKIKPDIAFCVDFGGCERVQPNVLEHIKNSPKIMGFDHHSETDISNGNFIQFKSPVLDSKEILSSVDFYSDMSAKSATSVIYRFFEALNQDVTNEQAYDLFFGLADDGAKRGLIKCDGKKGEIVAQKDLFEDKNAYEIYKKLKNKLNEEQIKKIAKTIDALSSLTPEQQAFKDSLKERIKFSENNKIAYVEIPYDDKQWQKLGGDNTITSKILNNFRQEILANKKYENVEMVAVFYEANGNYRLSAHTKTPILLDFYQYVEKNSISDFTKNSGGHPTRGGGGIKTNNPSKCEQWVKDIVKCDDFFEKEVG